jgi:hypothetical protein
MLLFYLGVVMLYMGAVVLDVAAAATTEPFFLKKNNEALVLRKWGQSKLKHKKSYQTKII